MSDLPIVEYVTDDRDASRRNKLVMMVGGNGDYYLGTCPEDEMPAGKMVRICTSGGAAFSNVGFMLAAASMYRALCGEDYMMSNDRLKKQRNELLEACKAASDLIEELWKRIPWGQSFLDAETIGKLNTVPGMLRRASEKEEWE